jgi:hypothetical protein
MVKNNPVHFCDKLADKWEEQLYTVQGIPYPDLPVYLVKANNSGRKRTLHRNLLMPIHQTRLASSRDTDSESESDARSESDSEEDRARLVAGSPVPSQQSPDTENVQLEPGLDLDIGIPAVVFDDSDDSNDLESQEVETNDGQLEHQSEISDTEDVVPEVTASQNIEGDNTSTDQVESEDGHSEDVFVVQSERSPADNLSTDTVICDDVQQITQAEVYQNESPTSIENTNSDSSTSEIPQKLHDNLENIHDESDKFLDTNKTSRVTRRSELNGPSINPAEETTGLDDLW